jgi:acyl transferase domain-containing protein
MKESVPVKPTEFSPIAIIGIGCLFPRSPGLKAYWRLLRCGHDAIDDVPATHWRRSDYFDPDPKRPDHVYCTRGGYLEAVPFDPTEFGIPPNLLESTDTSQLLGLVAARMALDDAGYPSGRAFNRERTSVVLGVTGTQELVIPLGARLGHPIWQRALEEAQVSEAQQEAVLRRIGEAYVPWQENSFPGLLGNVVAGRIANRLDLGGTNCVVDAACASSMSALHMAMMELGTGRSDMVVSGGVDTLNDIFMHMCFSRTQILSPTGDARPFSESADGTVLGEGVGLLVLKRLSDARAEGDRVYAVIRGIGTSSDGRAQSIYAPNADGQAKALRQAYECADVRPSTIGLVEAHGTGTRVGDRVEFDALRTVFQDGAGTGDAAPRRCALGSVKSMIGHTKAAAGAAGLIKAALALHHKVLPPTLKADAPSPDLDLSESPFYLNTRARPWIGTPAHPRRAAVSAFGFGGSNFHVVMEEDGAEKTEASWDASVDILAVSADSMDRLSDQLAQLKSALADADPDVRAHQAAESRRRFSHASDARLVLVFEPDTDMAALLSAAETTARQPDDIPAEWRGNIFLGAGPVGGHLAFLFPGQGSQYPQMGTDLMAVFPEALNAFEAMAGACGPELDLGSAVYPEPAGDKDRLRRQEADLRRTDMAQPAIGAISLAMLRILNRFGLRPQSAAGHSFGELTALLAAGRLNSADYCRLAVLRGRFMAAAGAAATGDAGAMLAVRGPLKRIQALIDDHQLDVLLANRNSPKQGVLSGATDAIEQAARCCKDAGLRAIRLPVAAAFHSPLVEAAQKPFAQALSSVSFAGSEIPVYANATAQPYPEDTAAAREQLGRQILSPVDFAASIQHMFDAGVRTFLEVGPKAVLTGLVRQILPGAPISTLALDAAGGKQNALLDLARTISALAAGGHALDLAAWEHAPAQPPLRRMAIPISGANLKPQPVAAIPDAPDTVRGDSDAGGGPGTSRHSDSGNSPPSMPPGGEAAGSAADGSADPRPAPQAVNPPMRDTMTEASRPIPAETANALAVVQEGIAAIQQLHQETADAHRQFLDVQTEASRAMRQLMAATQQLTTGEAAPLPVEPPLPADPQPPQVAAETAVAAAAIDTARTAASTAAHPSRQTPSGDRVTSAAPAPKDPATAPATVQALFEVVSDLTGYPLETLTAEMDLEADLGIDSIKRVEILSALEARLPDLPALAPEALSDLRTLADIAAAIGRQTAPSESPPAAADAVFPSSGAGDSAVGRRLFSIVADMTGYPVEMLDAQMDLEAAAMRERVPTLPEFDPNEMTTLNTLGEIVDYMDEQLGGQAGATPASTPAPAAPSKPALELMPIMLEVVTEKTGYPTEMLEMGMALDSRIACPALLGRPAGGGRKRRPLFPRPDGAIVRP